MSAGELRVPNAVILKNKGVPIDLHVLAVDDAGRVTQPFTRVLDEDDKPVLVEHWLQFTTANIADIEDETIGFGSMDAWEVALEATPGKALTRTLALLLQMWVPGVLDANGQPVPDQRRAGYALLDGMTDYYATAMGAAYMLANGVSPERAGEVLRAGVKNAAELRPAIDAAVGKMLDEADETAKAQAKALDSAGLDTPTPPSEESPGLPGSQDGSVPVAASTSSGG